MNTNKTRKWYIGKLDTSLETFNTVTGSSGVRYIKNGGNGYNINTLSGRAINFNGVDQNCTLPDKSNEISFPYTVLWFGTGRIGDVKHNAFYSNGTLEWHDKATTSLSTNFDKGQSTAITFHEDRIEIFVDGDKVKEVATNGYHLVAQKALGSRTATTQYLSGYLQDVIFINGTLSHNKIKFYSDRPEDFLYSDNDILKSKALTQDEIDSVVMFMPMCEYDGFVRDYINYDDNIATFNTHPGHNGFAPSELDYYHNVSADKSLNDDGSIRFKDNSTGTNTPGFTLYNPKVGNYKPLEANKYYMVKLSFKSYSADVKYFSLVIDGDVNCNESDSKPRKIYRLTSTKATRVMVKSTYGKSIGIIAHCSGDNANKTAYFDLMYMFVTEATGVYELKNYTASMNLTKLQTGLQTYKWKQDELGVPTGYTRGFEAEKYNYATANIPFNGKYRGIEAILKLETVNGSTRLELCARPDNRFYILQFLQNIIFYPKYNNSDIALAVVIGIPYPNVYYHVYFELIDDGTNATANTFRNGERVQTRTLSNYKSRESNDIGKLFMNWGNNVIKQGTIKLFNVYDTPQDPAELYSKRVSQGLIYNYDEE